MRFVFALVASLIAVRAQAANFDPLCTKGLLELRQSPDDFVFMRVAW